MINKTSSSHRSVFWCEAFHMLHASIFAKGENCVCVCVCVCVVGICSLVDSWGSCSFFQGKIIMPKQREDERKKEGNETDERTRQNKDKKRRIGLLRGGRENKGKVEVIPLDGQSEAPPPTHTHTPREIERCQTHAAVLGWRLHIVNASRRQHCIITTIISAICQHDILASFALWVLAR